MSRPFRVGDRIQIVSMVATRYIPDPTSGLVDGSIGTVASVSPGFASVRLDDDRGRDIWIIPDEAISLVE